MGNKIKNAGIGITLIGILYFAGSTRQCCKKTRSLAQEVGMCNTYELFLEEKRLFEEIKSREEENIESKMRAGEYKMYGDAKLMERYDELTEKYLEINSRLIDANKLEEKGYISSIGLDSFSMLLFILSGKRRKNYLP